MSAALPASTWFPVLTLVLGIVLKGAFDYLADRRAIEREREGRAEQRRDALRLRRAEFQRVTLLELQEHVLAYVRLGGRSFFEVRRQMGEGKVWHEVRLGEDLNRDIHREQTALTKLQVRVHDVEIRSLTKQLSDCVIGMLLADSLEQLQAKMGEGTDTTAKLGERIGVVLRQLDLEEDNIVEDGVASPSKRAR